MFHLLCLGEMLHVMQSFLSIKTIVSFLDISCPEGMIFDECRSTTADFCRGRWVQVLQASFLIWFTKLNCALNSLFWVCVLRVLHIVSGFRGQFWKQWGLVVSAQTTSYLLSPIRRSVYLNAPVSGSSLFCFFFYLKHQTLVCPLFQYIYYTWTVIICWKSALRHAISLIMFPDIFHDN